MDTAAKKTKVRERKRVVTMVVDHREDELIKKLRATNEPGIEQDDLMAGDIAFKCGDDLVGVVIERKATSDLSASIKDKRSKEQTWRLARLADEAGIGVIFMIEGRLRPPFGAEDQPYMLPYKNLRGSVLNRLLGDKMSFIETDSMDHTVEYLLDIRSRLEMLDIGNHVRSMPYEDVMNNVKKRTFATVEAMRIQALSVCQGMSTERARSIVSEFGTVADLVRKLDGASPELRLSFLQNIRSGASERRLGPALARNVLDFLGINFEEPVPKKRKKGPKGPKGPNSKVRDIKDIEKVEDDEPKDDVGPKGPEELTGRQAGIDMPEEW